MRHACDTRPAPSCAIDIVRRTEKFEVESKIYNSHSVRQKLASATKYERFDELELTCRAQKAQFDHKEGFASIGGSRESVLHMTIYWNIRVRPCGMAFAVHGCLSRLNVLAGMRNEATRV